MFGVGVAFYVDVCIVFKHRLNILPYPTWGWCLGIASSLVWLLAAGLWLGEHVHGCDALPASRRITKGTSRRHASFILPVGMAKVSLDLCLSMSTCAAMSGSAPTPSLKCPSCPAHTPGRTKLSCASSAAASHVPNVSHPCTAATPGRTKKVVKTKEQVPAKDVEMGQPAATAVHTFPDSARLNGAAATTPRGTGGAVLHTGPQRVSHA